DISHVQGAYTVASMAVFEQGRAKSSDYRRFRIRTVLDNNDFASMQEVLRRRFGHLLAASGVRLDPEHTEGGPHPNPVSSGEGTKDHLDPRRAAEAAKWGVIPDLVVIDGGKGQLSPVMEVMAELELEIPTIGLAK